MKFKILSYNQYCNHHVLKNEQNGEKHRADIFVDGLIIPEDKDYHEFCRELVGKEVEVDYFHTFEEIAHGVNII